MKKDNLTTTKKEETRETSHLPRILLNMLFKIERVSTTTPTSSRTHHYHDLYEIYYLYSGDRYYFIKDKTYHIKRGNMVLIKPYDIHSTSSSSKSGYDRILITFKKSYLNGFLEAVKDLNLFECFEKDIHVIPFTFAEQSLVESLLISMLNEYEREAPGYEYFLKSALVQLLLIVCRHSGQLDSTTQSYASAAHKTVSEVAAYINTRYFEDITLKTISDRFFISPCYFSRTFKRVTGIPFIEYLNGVRVKEAQRLLKQTEMSIVEVSEAVGFKSTTHFGRTFKGIVGISPIEYRSRRRK